MSRRGQRQPQHTQPQQRPQPTMAAQEARMFKRGNEQYAGWSQPMPRGYWHYFRAGDVLSLCGTWMFSGTARDDGNDERADTCAACYAVVQNIRRRQAQGQGGQTA